MHNRVGESMGTFSFGRYKLKLPVRKLPSNEERPVKQAFDVSAILRSLVAIKSSLRLRIIVAVASAYFTLVN